MSTVWIITYKNPEGDECTTEFLGGDKKPTENEAAIGIKDRLLQEVVLHDRTRGSNNHTVALLENHGYTIIGIEKANDSAS